MRQRRRIVLLFGAGIVLPSLLLGYLALRGVQNDRALLEKERLEDIRKRADSVRETVDGDIAAVESALSKLAAELPEALAAGAAGRLGTFAAGNQLVEQVFYLRGSAKIGLAGAKPLFIPDGSRADGPAPASLPNLPAEFQTAQRLEFQRKDLPKALAAYRQALGRAGDPRAEGAVLNAMARVQKKSGLFKEAVSTYESIVSRHGATVVAGGMPLGPSAALEIAGLSRELGAREESAKAALGLYRSLLRPEWELEKAEFEFFAGRARSMIEAFIADPPQRLDLAAYRAEFQALGDEETGSRKRTDRMIVFQANAAPALEARLKTAGSAEATGPSFARLVLDVGNSSYLVSIERPVARAGGESGTAWGVIIDAGRLREDVLRPALTGLFPAGETSWAVRDRDGTVLLTSGSPAADPVTLRTDLASRFPDWTIEFHQPPPRLIKTFLLSRRGFYSFVFLLLAGILVFGLALTIRSVSHELELARMKSDFVSTVSHEFKSPLTSIRQLAEMLQSGRVPSEERRLKYYDVLLEQSERLTLLTDNILSLAKIEEGRAEFSFEPTDVAALLTGLVASIQERVRHEGFEIGLEVEKATPRLAADRTSLSQAVTNLVDNAVKYSGDSRRISVGVSVEEKAVAIAVRDFGVGIRKEDIDRVFERFYRGGDELTRTVKGSGLGLTLVKEIVEAHRGKVEVESEPGKGSVFTIRLPLPRREGVRE